MLRLASCKCEKGFIVLYTLMLVFVTATSAANDTAVVLEPLVLGGGWAQGSECTCYNSTETERVHHLEHEPECRCRGAAFTEIPGNISTYMRRLTVADAGLEVLRATALQPYRTLLKDVTLMNLKYFRHIEPGTFHNLPELRTIYIYQAPLLKSIPTSVFSVQLPRIWTLRIVHTGLEEVPYLSEMKTDHILHMIDLENNQITRIASASIRVRAEQLLLNYNLIEEVEEMAFNGSQVAKLSLKGNRRLTRLHPDAFVGLQSLRDLDLSETSIIRLPTHGLQELDILRLQDTDTLKVFPSIYNFEYIKQAWLTYPYHCCAFHFPATHDPEEFAKHQEQVEQWCSEMTTAATTVSRVRRDVSNETYMGWGGLSVPHVPPNLWDNIDAVGTFHQSVTLSPGTLHALCGNLSRNYRDVMCRPEPDAFSPCEDIMGNWGLRLAVWLVAVAALVGNLAVLLVLLSSRFRMTVPKFLMCNLALADLCMGVYLLLIACMDARSVGQYFNHAIDWQRGAGCQVAGFLTVFASELSIFTLTVITSERWYTITYAIHLNKRLKLSTAAKIMAMGWLYSITMATLPLIGVSGYSKTSICLPMENKDAGDLAYLITLLSFNGLAFWAICACYGKMYCAIRGGQDAVAALTRSDMTVAKRMALLVFTDFACWAPIAFFGLTAVAGYPLIDVPHTKILLVFFYPLNSCANPYLYALLTQQYRRDLFILLSRYGLCSQRAARYKGAAGLTGGQRGCVGGIVGTCTGRAGGGGFTGGGCGPSHRGSLLTTLTSVDNSANTRQGSLNAVPESKNTPVLELMSMGEPVQPLEKHDTNGTTFL